MTTHSAARLVDQDLFYKTGTKLPLSLRKLTVQFLFHSLSCELYQLSQSVITFLNTRLILRFFPFFFLPQILRFSLRSSKNYTTWPEKLSFIIFFNLPIFTYSSNFKELKKKKNKGKCDKHSTFLGDHPPKSHIKSFLSRPLQYCDCDHCIIQFIASSNIAQSSSTHP